MLSIEDINREMGKNIFIYPMKHMRAQGNSIDLTASKFAWTSDGKYIYDKSTNKIVVPPHKTACVLTNEAIYVTKKIGGTYHSRVGLAHKGFGHIGTMLDPEYYGQSLISLHNTTDKSLEIEPDDCIASLIFYYLNTPILTLSHTSSPGHREKLSSYDTYDEYEKWCKNNRWAIERRELVHKFLQSEDYNDFKEKKKIDSKQWGKQIAYFIECIKKVWLKYFILLCISVIIDLLIIFLLDNSESVLVAMFGCEISAFIGILIKDVEKG